MVAGAPKFGGVTKTRWRRPLIGIGAVAVPLVVIAVALVGTTRGLDFQPKRETEYRLPWRSGEAHLCAQGNQTLATHRGVFATAWDFWMLPGTDIHAAREGVVIEVARRNGDWPGMHPGNHVSIRHADGSVATYGHLSGNCIQVKVGDAVVVKQIIGCSGMSGRTVYPHLHFHARDAEGRPVPVAFRDVSELDGVPRFMRRYVAE